MGNTVPTTATTTTTITYDHHHDYDYVLFYENNQCCKFKSACVKAMQKYYVVLFLRYELPPPIIKSSKKRHFYIMVRLPLLPYYHTTTKPLPLLLQFYFSPTTCSTNSNVFVWQLSLLFNNFPFEWCAPQSCKYGGNMASQMVKSTTTQQRTR